MNEYPKIQTVWLRDPDNKHKTLLPGQWAKPEFEALKDARWRFTEKVDGTNIRVMIKDGELRYGGKTDKAQIPTPLLEHLQSEFEHIKDALVSKFPDGICFYGEGYGKKIQKHGHLYNADGNGFALFDIKIGDYWLEWESVVDIAELYGLQPVPSVFEGDLMEMVDWVQVGHRSYWGDFGMEGLIGKPLVNLYNSRGERIITKLKQKDFAG